MVKIKTKELKTAMRHVNNAAKERDKNNKSRKFAYMSS